MGLNNFQEKFSNWELWPFNLRYFLISPVWLWYCIRSGSFWFFSSSNPTLTFGGFEGEGKKEMYDLLPEETYPKTIYIKPGEDFKQVLSKTAESGFKYPFIVKPDVGMKGLLFRKIDCEKDLQAYHNYIPVEYLIQELVNYPIEVSVFYYRYPFDQKGFITGFIQKVCMEVTGDGKSSLGQLIISHPKARHRIDEMKVKHQEQLQKVIPKNEKFILTYAANLNRGATFTNMENLIDETLLAVFDEISHKTLFYYGRYDIKCESIDDLKNKKNFAILEFNGCGAEPNHVYQSGYSLWKAYVVFLYHWKVLFNISRYNNKKGNRYWPFLKGWKFLKAAKKQLKILEKYDRMIPV